MGILGRTQKHKEPVTPTSHGLHHYNNISHQNHEAESPPLGDIEKDPDAAKIVHDLVKSHHTSPKEDYTPPKEEVDALVKAYAEKHGDADVGSIRKAVEKYLIKDHYKLHDSSP
ncbi:hypothetical protein GQ472_03855 [archaeon]|nr:hypothetical protein [archaeon]